MKEWVLKKHKSYLLISPNKIITENNIVKRNVFIAMTILSSATVFAAEDNAGKIHFTGEIIEPSCVIIGDGGTNEYKIPLGTYPTSFFSSIGTESDLVPVGIILKIAH